MTQVVVATLGSAGDLHPFLAVARALQESGQNVLMLSAESHRATVEREGVPFESILSAEQQTQLARHPDLWHPLRGFGVLWRYAAVRSVTRTVQILDRLWSRHGPDLSVLCSPLVLGARLAREAHPFRLITAHTAPSGLRSNSHPMFLAGHMVPAWAPPIARDALWRLLDLWKLEPLARPAIDRWLSERQLEIPRDSVFGHWINSPDATIGLFPSAFAPESASWPLPVRCVGFPLFQPAASPDEPEPAWCQWWNEGPSQHKVLVYPGSAVTSAKHQLEQAASTLARLGAKVLCIDPAQQVQQASVNSSANLHTVAWISDIPRALAQAKLWIHHGGIGSIAHGLATSVRQHVLPAAYDQHDNRWRIRQLQGENPDRREQDPPDWKALFESLTESDAPPNFAPWDRRTSKPGQPNQAVSAVLNLILEK